MSGVREPFQPEHRASDEPEGGTAHPYRGRKRVLLTGGGVNPFDSIVWATDRIMEASDDSQEDQEMEVSAERPEIKFRRVSMGNREMAKDGMP